MVIAPDAPSRFPDHDAAKLVYILYFVGFFLPICALGGVILAYVKRDDAGPVAHSHIEFQIRSFWMGLLWMIAAVVLWVVLVGWLVGIVWTVWALARFITGLLALNDGRAVRDPATWGFTA
ncbi:MAG: putative membrane protein [Paracoccaceae bacterium]|jgi:uncharacterized membrane protein